MKKHPKLLNATHRFTNFIATCNDCAWYSPADTISIDAALRHASQKRHNISLTTSTYATLHGSSTKT